MRKKKTILAGILLLLCACMLFPFTASAKTQKRTLNQYIRKNKKYLVVAYNNSHENVNIYAKANKQSGKYTTLRYGDAVVVNTSKLKKNKKYAWLPVYLNNRKTKSGTPVTGYVRLDRMKLSVLNKNAFSKNKTINRAINVGLEYLGTPFVLGGTSLSSGIDCSNFVAACFRQAGRDLVSYAHTDTLQEACREVFWHKSNKALTKKEQNSMKPGDLLFYYKYDTYGPIDHVAIYIGNGFMINSSGHYGETYPQGGITIKRVQYGSRYMVRCMRINGY